MNTTTNATAETKTETAAQTTEQPAPKILTAEQEIAALRAVHQFLNAFDRVPGSLAGQWGQAVDTVAVVANSLIAKTTTTTTDDTSSN